MIDSPTSDPALVVVLSSFPSVDVAQHVARVLVEERFCACANIVPSVISVFRWDGEMQTPTEALVFFKTHSDRFPLFVQRLQALHPYELPEIICIPASFVIPSYLAWVREATSSVDLDDSKASRREK